MFTVKRLSFIASALEHHRQQFRVGGAEVEIGHLGGGVPAEGLDFFPFRFHYTFVQCCILYHILGRCLRGVETAGFKGLFDDAADTEFVKQLVAACGEVGAVPRGIALPLGECGRHAFRGQPRELHATAAPQRRQQPDRGPVATPQRAIVLLPSFLHFHRDLEEVVTRLLA